MNKAFYRRIVNLIPSKDMKDFVFSNDFHFREKDLLRIILNYAPTLDKRLELFEEASRSLSDKSMRALANKRIAFEKRQYDAFMQTSPDIIYQIKIKTNSYSEDVFITKTFNDALVLIKKFIKYYEIKGNERTSVRYTITKFKTNLPNKQSDFSYKYNKVGEIGECILDGKLRIIYLDMNNFGNEVTCKKDIDCEECDRCIDNMFSTHFPHFLKVFDLVAYYDDLTYNPNHLTYGISCLDMEDCDRDSLVVTIENNSYIINRNGEFKDEEGYYRIYDAHEHPSCFEIIKPNFQDVPQEIIDSYNYAVPILSKIVQTREGKC